MNFLGLDVSDIDLDVFLTSARLAYVALGAIWIYASVRWRRRSLLILGLLSFIVLAWLVSNYPLRRLYGLVFPGDRARNLSWCMSVAAGNSPLSTGVIGQVSLEPFWASLVALLSFMSPERVLSIYPYLSLWITSALTLVLYFHFQRPRFGEGERWESSPEGSLTPGDLRGLLVAFFAILLATSPLDFALPFRAFWARTILLKPNHVLGYVLLPVLLGCLGGGGAGRRSPQRLLLCGLLLGLLGWVFLVHWAFFCFSLLLYLALTAVRAREGLFRELAHLALIVAVSSALVAPALYLLYEHAPAALSLARDPSPRVPMRSAWGEILPQYVSLFSIVTFDRGAVFFLCLIGVVDWLRGRGRLGLLWASQVFAGYVLWVVNYGLLLTARARESDEFYSYLLFVTSVAAGNGAFVLVTKLWHWAPRKLLQTTAPATGFIFLTFLPLGIPYWWEPVRMDSHFRESLDPVAGDVERLASWIRQETRGSDIILARGDLVQWIPALSGRRTLSASPQMTDALQDVLGWTEEERDAVSSLPAAFDYVVWDSAMSEALELPWTAMEERSDFVTVFEIGHIRVFRRVDKAMR